MKRPVELWGALRSVTVGVTSTGPPVVKAGAVVGEAELHENVICPLPPSVTLAGVAAVGSQFCVIDPDTGTDGSVCCISTTADTIPSAPKIANRPTRLPLFRSFIRSSPHSHGVCGVLRT